MSDIFDRYRDEAEQYMADAQEARDEGHTNREVNELRALQRLVAHMFRLNDGTPAYRLPTPEPTLCHCRRTGYTGPVFWGSDKRLHSPECLDSSPT